MIVELVGDICEATCFVEASVCSKINSNDTTKESEQLKICKCNKGFYKLADDKCKRC